MYKKNNKIKIKIDILVKNSMESFSYNKKIRLYLVTVFVFYFQKLIFENINKNNFLVFFKSKTCLVS